MLFCDATTYFYIFHKISTVAFKIVQSNITELEAVFELVDPILIRNSEILFLCRYAHVRILHIGACSLVFHSSVTIINSLKMHLTFPVGMNQSVILLPIYNFFL